MDLNTLPIHPYTGLQAIGWSKRGPIWPIVGGSQPEGEPEGEPDDLDDEAADGTDGDEGEGESEPEVDWKAKHDELQAQFEASQAKLARARAQAKALREKQEQATAPAPSPKPAAKAAPRPAKTTPVAEPEVITVQDDAEVERWQTKAVKAAARAELLARGCDPDLIDAPLSRLKVNEIDWDDDDPILDEYLDAMEERYPKLFAKPEPVAAAPRPGPRRAASIDQGAAANGGRPAQARKSFGDMLWESGGGAPARRR